jgi:zinc transport system ATP-binding protein
MPRPLSSAGDGDRTLLELSGITVRLGGSTIVENVDLVLSRGEIVTLIGPNGSGKTTLVKVALGLLAADAGAVRPAPDLRVGYVPQRLEIDATLPLTVERFLALAERRAGPEDIRAALETTGVGRLGRAALHEISGGEMRRVLLARAMLREPDLLVLDEPTAGVDVTGQADLYRLIARTRDRMHCGILLVSHDLHLVMAATDRVLCINRHVCCSGRPEDVSRHPEYLTLFGRDLSREIAVYTHQHDHRHEPDGAVHRDTAGHG